MGIAALMRETRNKYRILWRKPFGNKSLGRPTRCKSNIKNKDGC
jgi:hypothetical protein